MMFLFALFTSFAFSKDDNCLLESCEQKPKSQEKSVLQTPLQVCSQQPMTGFFRDSYCHTGPQDRGFHVVCAQVDAKFLTYTKAQGNDLSTASPRYGFPGLKPGDRWCLCAARWKQAKQAGFAPKVILSASNVKTLKVLGLRELKQFSSH